MTDSAALLHDSGLILRSLSSALRAAEEDTLTKKLKVFYNALKINIIVKFSQRKGEGKKGYRKLALQVKASVFGQVSFIISRDCWNRFFSLWIKDSCLTVTKNSLCIAIAIDRSILLLRDSPAWQKDFQTVK